MADNDDTRQHIMVAYGDNTAAVTIFYAIDKKTALELSQEKEKPTGRELQEWLEARGALADSPPDGSPAVCVLQMNPNPDEIPTVFVQYYRDGKLLDRKNGNPVTIADPPEQQKDKGHAHQWQEGLAGDRAGRSKIDPRVNREQTPVQQTLRKPSRMPLPWLSKRKRGGPTPKH